MLKTVGLYALLLFSFSGFAQGIHWETSLKAAFEKGKAENKILFVEFYSPTCPYCQSIQPFFQEKAVGDLYNSNFVNYQLDLGTEEGQQFFEDVNLDIFGIPFFLFFKADTTLVHVREVSATLNSVMQPGQMVVAGTYSAQNYARRFENGERSENFLAQFALFERIRKDIESNRVVADALWNIYPESKRNTRSSWTLTKKVLMDIDNGFVDFWLKNFKTAQAFEANNHYESASDVFSRLLMNTILSKRADQFDSQKWSDIQHRFGEIVGEDEILGLIWEKKARVLAIEGNDEELIRLGSATHKKYKNEAGSTLYFVSVFNELLKDNKALLQLENWLKSAQPLLGNNMEKVNYYLLMGKIKQKSGDLGAAKTNGELALELSDSNNKAVVQEFLNKL